MHEVLVNRLGGLSLPRKSVVRLTDRPDMTLDVYRGRKTTMQLIKKARLINQETSSRQPLYIPAAIRLISAGTRNRYEPTDIKHFSRRMISCGRAK